MNMNSTGMDKHINETLPSLSTGWDIFCRENYGDHVNPTSCRNAWRKIVPSSQTHRLIPPSRRSSEPLDAVVMPIRYLSDDGICAIVRLPSLTFRSLTLFVAILAKPSGMLQW